MTNTTEMPEKTNLADEQYKIIHNMISIDNAFWYPRCAADEKVGELTSYTRTNTIPTRAQVARALLNEAEERYETGDYLCMSDAIEAVLEEWEDAESK